MRISVGISVYNAEAYLDAAIKSVLQQTFTDWELIIIDDGSTDNSLEIAKKYQSDKIRVISDGVNRKLPFRLNQIVELSQYEFIARMDADDIIMPDRLQKQFDYLVSHPDVDLVSTGLVTISKNNQVLGSRYVPSNYSPSLMDIASGCSGIVHASVLARKEWFSRNPYDEGNIQAEDYKLWFDAFVKSDLKVGFVEDYLYCYREELNVNKVKMLNAYSQQIEVLKQAYNNGFVSFSCLNKNLLKYVFKKFVIWILFLIKKENILLERRLHIKNNLNYLQAKVDKVISGL